MCPKMTPVASADAKVWYHLMRGRTCVVHASGCEILPTVIGGRAYDPTDAQLKALLHSQRGKARLALASGATGANLELACLLVANPAQNWVKPAGTRQRVMMWRDAGSEIRNMRAEGLLGRYVESNRVHGTVVLTPFPGGCPR